MDLYEQLETLDNELRKITSSYSQSNPTQVLEIRSLRKQIKAINEQICILEASKQNSEKTTAKNKDNKLM